MQPSSILDIYFVGLFDFAHVVFLCPSTYHSRFAMKFTNRIAVSGWATSSVLKDTLVPVVARVLQNTNKADVLSVIKKAFLSVDQDIMDKAAAFLDNKPNSLTEGVSAVAPAIAGSCALLAMFDPKESILRVANVGDSRAVLGRYDESTGKYVTIKLSEDQTGFNEKEVARIKAEHPGEDQILDPKSGRLLGLAVTRAFGDHRWKWSVDQITKAKTKYRGSSVRPLTKTPPYMSAEPEITETQIQRGARGDFVIMASDGLWVGAAAQSVTVRVTDFSKDYISSEDAVECVVRWLNTPAHQRNTKNSPEDGAKSSEWDGNSLVWTATPDYFVVENDNAASHLVKNAFGGSRRDLFRAVMSNYPPVSRNVRDDITIQVIFFGDKV